MHTPTTIYYSWMEIVKDSSGNIDYVYPRSDPFLYEYPFDLLFNSIEDAKIGLEEWGITKEEYCDWVLVKRTLEVVGRGRRT